MLTEEQFNKWIARLESGEIKKGRGQLYDAKEGSYCALGVLALVCDLKFDKEGMFAGATDAVEEKNKGLLFLLPKNLVDSEIQYSVYCKNDLEKADHFEKVIEYLKDYKDVIVEQSP